MGGCGWKVGKSRPPPLLLREIHQARSLVRPRTREARKLGFERVTRIPTRCEFRGGSFPDMSEMDVLEARHATRSATRAKEAAKTAAVLATGTEADLKKEIKTLENPCQLL